MYSYMHDWAMSFIYRGHQGPVPKGHLDWKWLNKMKLKSSGLMANVHGGNLHHIYADTEILSARLFIILSMARWISTRLPNPSLPNTIQCIADSILPNPILPTFVKNDKISSYYFLFKQKYWWCVHTLLKAVIFRAILIRKTIIKCILIVE